MKNIKAVFVDIDGTLVEPTINMHKPDESALIAFDALKKKGILVVAASGRTPVSVGHVTDYPFDGFASANGSLVYAQGKKIYSGGFSKEEVRVLWDYLVENKVGFMLQGDNRYIYHDESDFAIGHSLSNIRARGNGAQAIKGNGDVEDGTIFKVTAFFRSAQQKEKTHRDLKDRFNLMYFSQIGEDPTTIRLAGEISTLHENKGSGIKHLLEYWNIKPEEAIAFGDNSNDIEMFELVDGYAMEESVQALKDKAVEVIGPVNSDTIYQLLKRKGIID